MIPDLVVLFSAFVLLVFIIAIIKESTVMFMLAAAFSFIMMVMVRLIEIPYVLGNGTTGTLVVEDLTSTIIFFALGILNVVLFFAYRVQHSAEELQQQQNDARGG